VGDNEIASVGMDQGVNVWDARNGSLLTHLREYDDQFISFIKIKNNEIMYGSESKQS
jgi:hypothetical protein